MKTSLKLASVVAALSLFGGTVAMAENHVAEDPMAEAQAFLASPTSMAQAIAAAEAATGGKVSSIEYQTGESGAPDLIMADVIMADGTEQTVALNPADGKVMNVTVASEQMNDDQDGGDNQDENGGENGRENGSENGGENGAENGGEGSNG